jgi:hypothetical protein
MATTPQYIGTAKNPSATISTASTNRDGTTGTYVALMAAGSSGPVVDMPRVNATGTTTAKTML